MQDTNNLQVDITPHPAILQVLGEIEFKAWQCVAELIDNSIDSFLLMQRAGTPIANPIVRVAFGRDTVVVKDNGPGMSLQVLEKAVKAGWTSNEKFGNLGLYGVGFNIATARLGSLTTIWTTRAGDITWYGLELDLPKIGHSASFILDIKTRQKSDANLSGTEIVVSKLRSDNSGGDTDWKALLVNSSWIRNNVTTRLSKIYSTMLREKNPQPIKFTLYVNEKKVSAWEHCVWPADWDVFRKSEGQVRPLQEFDFSFGKKYFSRSTGEIHNTADNLAPDDVIEIPERIYGWLGIQRYADEKEYGIDIIRNGRKIETECLDIFKWENEDGDIVTEYPIDDPRNRGRIVGEIHLDHGYVHYTKHRFEREHSSWKQLLQVVRNNEPLINRRADKYPGANQSYLGILFRTFRRNSPMSNSRQKWQDILFIKDNQKAKSWAEKYRKGVPEFLNNEKWHKELESNDVPTIPLQSDNSPNNEVGQSVSNEDEELILLGDSISTSTDEVVEDLSISATSTNSVAAVLTSTPFSAVNPLPALPPVIPKNENKRRLLPELSLHVMGIGVSGITYNLEVYDIDSDTATESKPPWKSTATPKGVYDIEIYSKHPIFNSSSFQIRDAVLAELAYIITSEETSRMTMGVVEGISYSEILTTLRNRYATTESLDGATLQRDIEDLRRQITKQLSKNLPETKQREAINQLTPEDAWKIELAGAQVRSGRSIIEYLEIRHIVYLMQNDPSLLFEAGCFNRSWTPTVLADKPPLLEEHRKITTRELLIPLEQLGDFTTSDLSVRNNSRSHCGLIRACINLIQESLAR